MGRGADLRLLQVGEHLARHRRLDAEVPQARGHSVHWQPHGQDRCLWGTNGLPWKESLDQVEQLGLKPEAKRKLLRDNAVELFRL
jgi:hypothetical protein